MNKKKKLGNWQNEMVNDYNIADKILDVQEK